MANCPTHDEFARRLDDRWIYHLTEHGKMESRICDKFDSVYEHLEKTDNGITEGNKQIAALDRKITYLLGGIGSLLGIVQIIIQIIRH